MELVAMQVRVVLLVGDGAHVQRVSHRVGAGAGRDGRHLRHGGGVSCHYHKTKHMQVQGVRRRADAGAGSRLPVDSSAGAGLQFSLSNERK